MSKADRLFEILARSARERGGAPFTSLECVLKSGRKLRYQFQDYPFGPDTTPEQAEALARRIVSDKYVYCQWDQAHPQANSEEDIAETIRMFILDWVARMRRVQEAASVSSDRT
jgi:hypothetical protein